jgi:hypothetical protein
MENISLTHLLELLCISLLHVYKHVRWTLDVFSYSPYEVIVADKRNSDLETTSVVDKGQPDDQIAGTPTLRVYIIGHIYILEDGFNVWDDLTVNLVPRIFLPDDRRRDPGNEVA